VFRNGTTLSVGYNAFGQLGTGTLTNRSVPGPLAQYYPFKGFATGGNHSVAFFNNSTVRSWGYNYTGELGTGTTTYSSVPVKTGDISGVKAVAAGAFHSLALTNNGTLWAWGNNGYGQLGASNTVAFSTTPLRVVDPASGTLIPNVSALAANGYNSMALASGQVWTWGSNVAGQLGVDPAVFPVSVDPKPVLLLDPGVTAIAAGSAFSYALAGDSTIWAWGNNSNGQLGNGTVLQIDGITPPTGCVNASGDTAYIPVQVKTLSGTLIDVVQIAAGYHHGLARLANGTVWAWGANSLGQLGTSQVTGNSCYAVQVELPSVNGSVFEAVDIRAFGSSSMAKAQNGAWYVWGGNFFGQLGTGSDGNTVPLPVKMSGF
jgi:alpha-tubulin suppressor-like RCC1 family protein